MEVGSKASDDTVDYAEHFAGYLVDVVAHCLHTSVLHRDSCGWGRPSSIPDGMNLSRILFYITEWCKTIMMTHEVCMHTEHVQGL